MVLTEQEFRLKSDDSLERARRSLLPLADVEGFEVEPEDGVLTLIFDEPRDERFIVSPNAPARQIWVSAMAKGYKLAWSAELGEFAIDGETLPNLLERLTKTFLGR
jgi:CyaY protein